MTFGIHNFPFPVITPRLILQPPHMVESAIHDYINAVNESLPEISPWLPWAKVCLSLTQATEHIKNFKTSWNTQYNNYTGLQLWLVDKTQNKFIGNITEALNALIRYYFLQIGFQRVEIRYEKQNYHAQATAQHLGFELDGILRNGARAVSNRELTDVLIFSRINANDLPEIAVIWPKS